MTVFSSLSDLVKNFESGGNYSAQNTASTASGAYQFVNSTWQNNAAQIGVDINTYPTAKSAPAAIQDAVFQHTVAVNGLNDWTCPGCNPGLAQYLAQNPDAAHLPTLSDGSGTTSQAAAGGTATGSENSPNASASSNVSGCTSWLSTPVACVTATLTELGLILLALLVITIGLYFTFKKELS